MPTKVTSLYIPELRQKISLRIPEADWPTWQSFLELAKRENESPGSIILKQMLEYTRLHSPGNPQQRLDTLQELGHAYKAPKVCHKCRGSATRKAVVEDNTIVYCCSSHMPKDTKFWKELGSVDVTTGESE